MCECSINGSYILFIISKGIFVGFICTIVTLYSFENFFSYSLRLFILSRTFTDMNLWFFFALRAQSSHSLQKSVDFYVRHAFFNTEHAFLIQIMDASVSKTNRAVVINLSWIVFKIIFLIHCNFIFYWILKDIFRKKILFFLQ
jgi:hypothetical protein